MTVKLPLTQMTMKEKLHMLELLWSDLRRDEAQISFPQWHKDLLDERERLVREGRAHFTDWESAKRWIAERTHKK